MVRTKCTAGYFRADATIGRGCIDLRASLCTLCLLMALWAGAAKAEAPIPVVTPMPGRFYLGLGNFDLSTLGYTTAEFFFAGTATSYNLKGEASANGRWEVVPAATAPYATRMVVVRPS